MIWIEVCFCPNGAVGNFLASGSMVCFQDGTDPSREVMICDPCGGSRKVVPVPSFQPGSELQLVGFVRDTGSQDYKVFGICVVTSPLPAAPGAIYVSSPLLAAPSVMYDSRKGEWAVTGTAELRLPSQIERSAVWRGFLWLVARGSRGWEGREYALFKCRLEDGVGERVTGYSGRSRPSKSEPGLDLVVHKNRLFLVGMVEDENAEDDEYLYECLLLAAQWPWAHTYNCVLCELKVTQEQVVEVDWVLPAPVELTDEWGGAFAGRDDLLYIQACCGSPRVVVCNLSTTPSSWWLLPPSPAAELQHHDGVTLVIMPVQPELDAFVGSQS